ncbi:phosphoribosyltransferase family protein [Myxococcaceae bacterium GXIMD 01537]
MVFRDRADAGRRLAGLLLPYRSELCRVLGISRGGVRVAFEVHRALDARLDVWVARRVLAPGRPELSVGAVAEGGGVVLDTDLLRVTGLSHVEVMEQADSDAAEVRAEVQRLRGGLPPPNVRNCTVIVVDDGVLTGMTASAALRSLRESQSPRRLVFATPVASVAGLARVRREADEVRCLEEIPGLRTLGERYEDFRPLPDVEVMQLLQRGHEPVSSREVIDSTDTGGRWM